MTNREAGFKGYAVVKEKFAAYREKLQTDAKLKYKNKVCLNCGKALPYEKRMNKFCDHSCCALYHNRINPRIGHRKNAKKYFCVKCGKAVRRGRKYCDAHIAEARGYRGDITLGDAIYNRLHKSSAYNLVRSRAREKTKHWKQVCGNCDYDKHVETCHKKPISMFSLDVMISEINKDDNLELLCPNCHWESEHQV